MSVGDDIESQAIKTYLEQLSRLSMSFSSFLLFDGGRAISCSTINNHPYDCPVEQGDMNVNPSPLSWFDGRRAISCSINNYLYDHLVEVLVAQWLKNNHPYDSSVEQETRKWFRTVIIPLCKSCCSYPPPSIIHPRPVDDAFPCQAFLASEFWRLEVGIEYVYSKLLVCSVCMVQAGGNKALLSLTPCPRHKGDDVVDFVPCSS